MEVLILATDLHGWTWVKALRITVGLIAHESHKFARIFSCRAEV
jgi:hypothetical protein